MRLLRACLLCLSACCAGACGKHSTFTDAAPLDDGRVLDSDPEVGDACCDGPLDAMPDAAPPDASPPADAPPDGAVPADSGPSYDGGPSYDATPDSGAPADGPTPTFDGGAATFDAPVG
jgi:hypothetical protein